MTTEPINLRNAQLHASNDIDASVIDRLEQLEQLENFSLNATLTKPSDRVGASVIASWYDEWNDHEPVSLKDVSRLTVGELLRGIPASLRGLDVVLAASRKQARIRRMHQAYRRRKR